MQIFYFWNLPFFIIKIFRNRLKLFFRSEELRKWRKRMENIFYRTLGSEISAEIVKYFYRIYSVLCLCFWIFLLSINCFYFCFLCLLVYSKSVLLAVNFVHENDIFDIFLRSLTLSIYRFYIVSILIFFLSFNVPIPFLNLMIKKFDFIFFKIFFSFSVNFVIHSKSGNNKKV